MYFFIGFLMASVIGVFFNMLWKWSSAFLVVILFESISALVLALLMSESEVSLSLIFILFTFFVSEALILLSSLYSSMRLSGFTLSSILLN